MNLQQSFSVKGYGIADVNTPLLLTETFCNSSIPDRVTAYYEKSRELGSSLIKFGLKEIHAIHGMTTTDWRKAQYIGSIAVPYDGS